MNFSDWIGFTGVTILLVAYLLNLFKKISTESYVYISLNFVGAGLACLASVLIKYVPFILLEAAWTLVSFISLIRLIILKKSL
ncbi:hypothetical protein WSM22_33380 [Cytophagales bacterium WSM2-2]|nr:hypothetical protein WSM22_33380 [Cytophagales bacterium WSM2-2]